MTKFYQLQGNPANIIFFFWNVCLTFFIFGNSAISHFA
jgi:hypothetical protein